MPARSCLVCGRICQGPRCEAHALGATAGSGNTSWNSSRDRATQARFRATLIARDGLRCADCGATDVELQAHHTTRTDGRLLCRPCHKEVDDHAR